MFSKGLPKAAVDRPQNVEGCSASFAAVRRHHADPLNGLGRQQAKSSPVARTGRCQTPSSRRNNDRRNKLAAAGQEIHPERGRREVTAVSLAELSPPFFGDRARTTATTPSPPRSRQNVGGNDHRKNENVMPPWRESGDGSPAPPYKRNAALPTVRVKHFKFSCKVFHQVCVCVYVSFAVQLQACCSLRWW